MMDTEQYSIRPDVLAPGAVVGHWRILQGLGRRGDGALYQVEDVRRPGEVLALKLSLRSAEGPSEGAELRLTSSHPNVARLHAWGRWPCAGDGFFYFVRDDVQGQPLTTWAETVNPTFLQITAVLRRLAFAIDFMHEHDHWHREVLPENIRVREGDGEPLLLDLRAGHRESVETLTRHPLPPELQVFRSPEALRFLRMNLGRPGASYHFRRTDDLYALGATAYRLVTGHPPFSPELPLEQLHSEIELRSPPPPWEVNERVPKPLGAIILRLMNKSPEVRTQSGEALSAELMIAVSAGARSIWASRVFAWAHEEDGQESLPRRISPPKAPAPSPWRGPRLPCVVHFSPAPGRGATASRASAWKEPGPGQAPPEPWDPGSQAM
jgi:eukaryotic-like serine/threonine-protein kinase